MNKEHDSNLSRVVKEIDLRPGCKLESLVTDFRHGHPNFLQTLKAMIIALILTWIQNTLFI